jgi:hypothetical protein
MEIVSCSIDVFSE